jgi:dipeptidyl aminopeptidase/acylaminoacyl peptidase
MVALLAATGCDKTSNAPTEEDIRSKQASPEGVLEARAGFETQITGPNTAGPEAPEHPDGVFDRVHYDAPLGENVAYVTARDTTDAKKPGVVYIHGGFNWSIGPSFWQTGPRKNDQTASAFRESDDLVLMLPSLRGTHQNPGHNECFYGEVDDILAAAEHLAKHPDVDPDRIYLVGHSTGATLALLAASATDQFRGVFAYGPVSDPASYGDACMPPNAPEKERYLRAPKNFIEHIESPTFIIEGSNGGNVAAFEDFAAEKENAPVEMLAVPNADHFSVIAPANEAVIEAIRNGTGSDSLELTVEDIQQRFRQ